MDHNDCSGLGGRTIPPAFVRKRQEGGNDRGLAKDAEAEWDFEGRFKQSEAGPNLRVS